MAIEWRVSLLDTQDRELGRDFKIRGGSLSWSIFNAVAGTGQVEVTEKRDNPIDPDTVRFAVTRAVVEIADPPEPEPFGIWIPVAPSSEIDLARDLQRTTFSMTDKTGLLNRQIGRWISASTVVPVTTQVRQICADVGETLTAIVDSSATLSTAIVPEPEDTWLQHANNLLKAIGYGSIEADLHGRLSAAPYVDPESRPLVGTYGDLPGDLKLKQMIPHEAPTYEVPNLVRIIVPATDTSPGFIGEARNDDPASPLSTVSRGERPLVEQGEAVSQAIANQIAARRLAEASQVTERHTITHPPNATGLNSRVEIRPLGASGTVVNREVRFGIGAVVTDVVRRVWGGGSWR